MDNIYRYKKHAIQKYKHKFINYIMAKKIIISILLIWILLIMAVEMSIISEDLIMGVVDKVKIKILKTIGFYSIK